jgi:Uma2 family endonuclease
MKAVLCWRPETISVVTAVRTRNVAPDRRTGRDGRDARPVWERQRLTLAEFLALPEEKPALEFEEGEVTQKVSPKSRHSALQGGFTEVVNRRFRRRKVALALPELRFTFGGHSFVPDVSVLTWEHIPRTPTGDLADDLLIPPDIAVEIVSPEQRVNALVRRCVQYVTLGVRIALLIDPDDRSVLLFMPDAVPVALTGTDAIDLESVLPGFRLTVNDLFKSLLVS